MSKSALQVEELVESVLFGVVVKPEGKVKILDPIEVLVIG
jgi:hypothetical protein